MPILQRRAAPAPLAANTREALLAQLDQLSPDQVQSFAQRREVVLLFTRYIGSSSGRCQMERCRSVDSSVPCPRAGDVLLQNLLSPSDNTAHELIVADWMARELLTTWAVAAKSPPPAWATPGRRPLQTHEARDTDWPGTRLCFQGPQSRSAAFVDVRTRAKICPSLRYAADRLRSHTGSQDNCR